MVHPFIYFIVCFIVTPSTSSVARNGGLHKLMDSEELQFYFGTNSVASLPDYEIVDLPEGLWSGRESVTIDGSDEDEGKHLNFKVFNKQVELNLFPNKHLISPHSKIVKKSGNKTTKNYYASSQPNFCHFLHENANSTAAISNCDASEIHGLIFLPDESFEILPLSSRLKFHLDIENNEQVNVDDTRAVQFAKIPHLIKRSTFDIPGTFENDFVVTNFRHLPMRKKFTKQARGISFDRPHVELGLFFDEAFYKIFAPFFEHDEKKLQDFILSYINGVQSLYHHHSLGRKIDFTIVYLEIMEEQPLEMPHAYGERNELIDNFCDYQKKLNPGDDRDPNHYDMSVYISGLDFFAWDANGYKNGVTMGLATVAGVCQEDFNCIIAEFGTNNQFGRPYPSAGFASVFILAHEIGHNLGMSHDATGNSCSKDGHVMSPSRGTQGETTWSQCSALVAQKLNWAKCLFDKPSVRDDYDAWKFNGYPGVSYTAKDQCEILLRDRTAYPFFNGAQSSICENLHCRTPSRSGFFFAGPALTGTDCGNGNWCEGGSCVAKNIYSISTTTASTTTTKKPTWSPWRSGNCKSECIKHSKGTQTNYRTCIYDRYCEGTSVEHDLCDDQKLCPVRKTSIDYGTQKCREFSRRVNTVDGKGLGLQARFEPLKLWMPCAIFCKHKNATSYFSPRVELHSVGIDPYFPDGTWCNREGNVNYFCLQHHCLPENTKLSKSPIQPLINDELPEEAFAFRFDDTILADDNAKFVTFRP